MTASSSAPGSPPPDGRRVPRGLDALVALGFEAGEPDASTVHCERVDGETVRTTHTLPAMGTHVTIVALGDSSDRLGEAVDAAFTEMHRRIALLSRHDPGTPLSHLNRAGRLDDPPPELVETARQARRFHRLTRGVFDITVGPLVRLYESRAFTGTPWPSEAEVQDARALVGTRHVTLRPGRLRFARQGMALTLDGLAKGGIVDAMAAVLERHGVSRFLVDAGGDIRARGTKEGGRPWIVAVHDPSRPEDFAATLHLAGGAVATSGSYAHAYDLDEIHHHLLDPRAGTSPGACRSVSVTAPTALEADALATSVFLMGPEAGVRFIDGLADCACLVLDRNGRTFRSRAWRDAEHAPGQEETA